MSKQTKLEQSELLNTQTSADENQNKEKSSNTQLLEREKVDKTPFYVTGNNDEGFIITLGKWRITEPKATKAEAILEIDNEFWNTMGKMIGITCEMMQEEILKEIKEEILKEIRNTNN